MSPVILEVLAPMLSTVEMKCRGCGFIFGYVGLKGKYRSACTNEYPDEWKLAVDRLSKWLQEISYLYRHRIQIRVIDAQSPLGLWKQIRYRLFRFPAFIVNKRHTYIGWDSGQLENLIDERIHQAV
ncbi:MAG: hypothetical protein DRG87_01265 [Deltaproteobacteria bacterium]|nr:hypothetical protein [Deltaproteobacteria bacterium]RLB31849.1 MAG: hypothetical protein DRG87_01265 [Deltaproteobacteria bacterium]